MRPVRNLKALYVPEHFFHALLAYVFRACEASSGVSKTRAFLSNEEDPPQHRRQPFRWCFILFLIETSLAPVKFCFLQEWILASYGSES